MNWPAIDHVSINQRCLRRGGHFADCIPNASQRDITFRDIPHSKSFI